MISDDIIQRIKDENDIVDVISETVRLRRAGRNYIGLCPFHSEKTPSFSVSPDKQIFKCFGCGEAGNAITFLMKVKNLSFPEACEILAEKANIELKQQDGFNKEERDRLQKFYTLNVEAARFFFSNLNENNKIKEYFHRRGITDKTIKRFGLGYALDSWNSLLNYLKKKGYSELDLLSLGLVVKGKNDSVYDRFRNRVIFPVFNVKGKVIGFGGRVLDDSKPKYLNSPETVLFQKGTNLYGLNYVIKSSKSRTIIMVEGYMDCISLHQYGVTNVVASLGTALTVSQAKLLKRYADTIIIAFDADTAGQAATERGLEILRQEGFEVKVLTVPEGKDPDEFVKSNGTEAFERLIRNSLPLIEYKIKRAKEGLNLKNKEMGIQYIKNVVDIVADLDPVEKDVYIKKVSEESGIKEHAIYDLLNEEIQKNVKNSEEMNNKDNFRQKLYLEPAYIKAERNILKLMLYENYFQYIINNFYAEDMIIEAHGKLFNIIIQSYDIDNNKRNNFIELKCDDVESAKEWVNINEIDDIDSSNEESIIKLINQCISEVRKYKLEESKKEIMKRIKECEAQGLLEESIKLAQELIYIDKEQTKLSLGERR